MRCARMLVLVVGCLLAPAMGVAPTRTWAEDEQPTSAARAADTETVERFERDLETVRGLTLRYTEAALERPHQLARVLQEDACVVAHLRQVADTHQARVDGAGAGIRELVAAMGYFGAARSAFGARMQEVRDALPGRFATELSDALRRASRAVAEKDTQAFAFQGTVPAHLHRLHGLMRVLASLRPETGAEARARCLAAETALASLAQQAWVESRRTQQPQPTAYTGEDLPRLLEAVREAWIARGHSGSLDRIDIVDAQWERDPSRYACGKHLEVIQRSRVRAHAYIEHDDTHARVVAFEVVRNHASGDTLSVMQIDEAEAALPSWRVFSYVALFPVVNQAPSTPAPDAASLSPESAGSPSFPDPTPPPEAGTPPGPSPEPTPPAADQPVGPADAPPAPAPQPEPAPSPKAPGE